MLNSFVLFTLSLRPLCCSFVFFSTPRLPGTKPKALTPQWDIMAKRVCEPGRTVPPLQDQIHELD